MGPGEGESSRDLVIRCRKRSLGGKGGPASDIVAWLLSASAPRVRSGRAGEVIKRRFKGLHQITTLSSLERLGPTASCC